MEHTNIDTFLLPQRLSGMISLINTLIMSAPTSLRNRPEIWSTFGGHDCILHFKLRPGYIRRDLLFSWFHRRNRSMNYAQAGHYLPRRHVGLYYQGRDMCVWCMRWWCTDLPVVFAASPASTNQNLKWKLEPVLELATEPRSISFHLYYDCSGDTLCHSAPISKEWRTL